MMEFTAGGGLLGAKRKVGTYQEKATPRLMMEVAPLVSPRPHHHISALK